MDSATLQESVLPDPLRRAENLLSTATEPEMVGKFNQYLPRELFLSVHTVHLSRWCVNTRQGLAV